MTTPDQLLPPAVDALTRQVLPVLHMGGLHAYEKVLVLLVAFGPFVVLGVVVFLVRRRDLAEEEREGDGQPSGRAHPG